MFDRSKLLQLCAAAGVSAALIAGTTAAAFAKDQPTTTTVVGQRAPDGAMSARVRYSDLNLTSASDIRRLTWRVSGAAHRVCADHDFMSLANDDYNDCRRVALSGARPQMDRAIQRARELAANGTTSIPAVAIAVVAPAF